MSITPLGEVLVFLLRRRLPLSLPVPPVAPSEVHASVGLTEPEALLRRVPESTARGLLWVLLLLMLLMRRIVTLCRRRYRETGLIVLLPKEKEDGRGVSAERG